jgi:hypothetical protein
MADDQLLSIISRIAMAEYPPSERSGDLPKGIYQVEYSARGSNDDCWVSGGRRGGLCDVQVIDLSGRTSRVLSRL